MNLDNEGDDFVKTKERNHLLNEREEHQINENELLDGEGSQLQFLTSFGKAKIFSPFEEEVFEEKKQLFNEVTEDEKNGS